MKIASTRKSLLIVIFLLLIIDLVVLFFFVSKNKPDNGHQRDRKESGLFIMLSKDANFTPEQMAEYQELREEQFKNVKPLFSKIRKSKDNFYSLLYTENVSDSTVNALSDSIAANQKALDLQMFTYFQKVRLLCTPDQVPKFDSSIKKVVMRMTGRQGPSGRPKSDSATEKTQTHPNNN